MFEHIFSLIAPHLCLGCRSEGSLLCAECVDTLLPLPVLCYICQRKARRPICSRCQNHTPLDELIVGTVYGNIAEELVHRFKFGRASAAAPIIARLMAQKFTDIPPGTVVTYAPTAAKRARVRGYDQSKLIASQLAKELRLPFRPLLVRTGNTRQVGANKQQRKEQVEDAFTARPAAAKCKRVILVDDVITTGATMEASAAALRRAGVECVTGAAFAAA